jgi:hypothetical protein
MRLNAAELDASFDNRKKRVGLFGRAINKPATWKFDDARLLCKLDNYRVSEVCAEFKTTNDPYTICKWQIASASGKFCLIVFVAHS